MSQLAIIKISQGNFDGGFSALVRIEEGGRCIYDKIHSLPPAPQLPELYQSWKSGYSDRRLKGDSDGEDTPSREKSNFRALEIVEGQTTNFSIRELANELETGFNKWLNSLDRGVQELREGLLDNLNKTEDVLFVIETAEETLCRLPWHRWDFFDRYEKGDVLLSFPNHTAPRPPIKLKEKVKILVILGEGSDINVQADLHLLQDRLPPDVEILEPLIATSREKVHRVFWEEKFDILFFAGHSSTDFDNGRGKFYINDTESLTVADLKEGLKRAIANGLKLAIFNSCDGIGLGRDLADLQMPAIVVMREKIPDEAAQRFLEFFLKAFALEGKTLSSAVTEARKRLKGLESRYPCASWLPVLCQHPEGEMLSWESLSLPQVKKKRLNRNLPAKVHWGVSLLAFVFLALPLSLPKLAVAVNNWGFKRYQEGDFSQARTAWNLVTKLNPNNPASPYNLGWVCEKLKDFECAKEQYFISANLDLDAGYSQLGRLYIIRDKNYSYAVNLLLEGLKRAKDDRIIYSLQKNLGWARLEQGRYQEALYHLQEAIKLDSDRAPARCLLAQVYEGIGDDKAAIVEWQICLDNAKPENADEDIWIGMALERLQTFSLKDRREKTKKCKLSKDNIPCPP